MDLQLLTVELGGLNLLPCTFICTCVRMCMCIHLQLLTVELGGLNLLPCTLALCERLGALAVAAAEA